MCKWGLLVIYVAACGHREEAAKKVDPLVVTEEIRDPEPPNRRVAPPAVDDIPQPPPSPIDPPAQVDPPAKPACVDHGALISFDPAKLRACFDTNDDAQADRCVTWRRDGKVQTIDTMFDVEDTDAPEEVEPPVEFRSDVDNNDDERITLDGASVEVCPFDRACLKLMPKIGDGEIAHVLTDPDYKRGVFVIRDSDGSAGTIESWDLQSGRMRARVAMRRLVGDETYDFYAHLGSAVVIAIADDSNGRALGSIFGVDGGFRGELAQGSRNLDVEKTFRHAGVFGIVDIGPVDEETPYVLYLTSLANGGALGKFTIKRDEVASGLELFPLKNNFVAVAQWGAQLRIDMIDLRARTNRVLFVPSC